MRCGCGDDCRGEGSSSRLSACLFGAVEALVGPFFEGSGRPGGCGCRRRNGRSNSGCRARPCSLRAGCGEPAGGRCPAHCRAHANATWPRHAASRHQWISPTRSSTTMPVEDPAVSVLISFDQRVADAQLAGMAAGCDSAGRLPAASSASFNSRCTSLTGSSIASAISGGFSPSSRTSATAAASR